MADFCGECAHLDWNNKERYTSRDRYYCDYQHKYVELTEKGCYKFMKDPKKCKSDSGTYTPSGCYITTIICDVLGYSDDCEILNTLRNFRDTVLKRDENNLSLLLEYDFIGPQISEYILREENNKEFCFGLLNHFLIPCTEAIITGTHDEAIAIYKNMVVYLNDEFNLPSVSIDTNQEYDLETLGKGRIRQPKTSE